jgi:hypothetical protein
MRGTTVRRKRVLSSLNGPETKIGDFLQRVGMDEGDWRNLSWTIVSRQGVSDVLGVVPGGMIEGWGMNTMFLAEGWCEEIERQMGL